MAAPPLTKSEHNSTSRVRRPSCGEPGKSTCPHSRVKQIDARLQLPETLQPKERQRLTATRRRTTPLAAPTSPPLHHPPKPTPSTPLTPPLQHEQDSWFLRILPCVPVGWCPNLKSSAPVGGRGQDSGGFRVMMADRAGKNAHRRNRMPTNSMGMRMGTKKKIHDLSGCRTAS